MLADSDRGGVEIDDVQSVAQTALATRRTARATEPTRLGRQALVAEPLIEGGEVRGVAVFADGLGDVQDNVSLIRRRILVAGAFAFLIAVLGGYLVARALSLRIERLERAARKVASGDFSDRIEPDSDDELGQLARRLRRHVSASCSGSTTRASSSSPRPRTSCARRCSRSAASSSCWRTRSSTRPPAASSSTTCARRSSG